MRTLEYSSQKGGHCSQELMSSHKNGSPNRFGYPNSLPPLLPSPSQCDFFSIILMLSTMRPYTSIVLLYLYELRVRVSTRCAPYRPGMLTNNKQTKEANRQNAMYFGNLRAWERPHGRLATKLPFCITNRNSLLREDISRQRNHIFKAMKALVTKPGVDNCIGRHARRCCVGAPSCL